MRHGTTKNRIMLVQILGILCIILLQFSLEAFDLPHVLFGGPETPDNYTEAIIEAVAVIAVGAVLIMVSRNLLKRIRTLEKFIVVCSGCKRVRVDDKWITLEDFMQSHTETQTSHGLCEDCLQRLYPEIADEVKKLIKDS